MDAADNGTVKECLLIYSLDSKTYKTPLKTLRGDYRNSEGNTQNRLRRWEKHEFKPRPDDIFQERLYCIQWIRKDSLESGRKEIFFASVTEEDLARERLVEQIVADNIEQWQQQGFVPDMVIEPGDKTDEPIRTRGWTYWHHLFNARHLLLNAISAKHTKKNPDLFVLQSGVINRNASTVMWDSSRESASHTFANQALNTL